MNKLARDFLYGLFLKRVLFKILVVFSQLAVSLCRLSLSIKLCVCVCVGCDGPVDGPLACCGFDS